MARRFKRGAYIILEGGEGCGKSTQTKLLHDYLTKKGILCVQSREPGGVKEAEAIREILLDKRYNLDSVTELFLFEAARTEFFKQEVIPNLIKGVTVISDRSGYSTEAYQGYAGGIALKIIKLLNELATFKVKPDLAFMIDIKAKNGLKKENNADRFAAKGLEYHKKVNKGYRKIAEQNPGRCIKIDYITNGEEKMHKEIIYHVEQRLFGKIIL